MFKCNGIEETNCNDCEAAKPCYVIGFTGQAEALCLCLKCMDRQAMMRHRAKNGKKPAASVPLAPVKPV